MKSVDLDSWTDEQLQSVLRWGNARANKYWESKLAPGHIPSEAKIENFIRTKYESKRWVMEGPIPDPSTLDVEGDDDVPLNLVKEKHNLERSSPQRATSQPSGPSQIKRAQQPDLFAEDAAPRTSIAGPPTNRVPPKAEAAPPKQTKPADSLLGLDFFGAPTSAPSRPASTVSAPGGQSRPDLKQSILSLYSTTPKPQPAAPSQQAFGGFVSPQSPPPTQTSHSHSTSQSSFGGMQDAFSSLSFSPPAQSQNSKPSAFAGLGNLSSQKSTPSVASPPSAGFGGSFFDSKPTNKPAPVQVNRTFSSSSGFGAFDSAPGSSPMPHTKASSGLEDLFDFGAPSTTAAPPKQTLASPQAQTTSVFNLSAPQPTAQPAQPPPAATSIGWGNNTDAWGSNDAWSTPDPISKQSSPTMNKPLPPMQTQASSNDFGWGSSSGNSLASQSIVPSGGGFSQVSSPPKVSVDEDFGGWSSAVPVTPAASAVPAKTGGGFAASEDLFSNVWE